MMSENNNISTKIVNATKWSALTEVTAKLITPVTAMIMARLLTPEAYGVVATFSIIISFADIFSDAGFQRFLIQHEFCDKHERDNYTNVAFWSNLVLSLSMWAIIFLFADSLASLVGSPGLGFALTIACAAIPLTGFCSIQTALFKRDFNFKTLFWLRLVYIIVPIFVTIPLAILFRNYWALVLGSLVSNLAGATLLFLKSKWKPKFYYNFTLLKSMLSFCVWSLIDAILVWITLYADIFFIAAALNTYYLGLYRTAIATVSNIVSLITAAVLPVILPALSRLQDDIPEMRRILLKFQKTTGILLIPLGVAFFVYHNFITNILLGSQWMEGAGFLGLWGLVEALTVVFARFCSPVFPAIGKPRISVITQLAHLVVLIPAILISGQYGFEPLYITRSLVRVELVLVYLIAIYIVIRQSPWKMFVNVLPEVICSLITASLAIILLRINSSILFTFANIIFCTIIYFASLYLLFPRERVVVSALYTRLIYKKKT